MRSALALVCLALLSGSAWTAPAVTDPAPQLLQLDNGHLTVGVDRTRGGAITWLSWKAYPHNAVNLADPGRLIQQSYYAGRRLDRRSEGQSQAWSPWDWNPIQGGGISSWARVTAFARTDEGTLHVETIPKLWDMPNEEAAAVMRQWIGLEPGSLDTAVIRCEFVSQRAPGDKWGPPRLTFQEIPAAYFTRNFSTVKSYLGDGAWRLESQPPGPPWGKASPPRNAMALFETNGHGVAIFSPAATRTWNFGPHGNTLTADPKASPCMHVAPLDQIALGPKSTYTYRYWIVVGNESSLAKRLDELWERYGAERASLVHP